MLIVNLWATPLKCVLERAAVKLNAKNMAVKVYKGVYNCDTKENREAFFASPDGMHAWHFFFACLVYAKPHVLLPQEGWAFIFIFI